MRSWRELVRGKNVDDLTAATLPELHTAVLEREQGVVLALTHVQARVNLGATLTNEDRASRDLGSVEYLDAETLRIGVTTVLG